MYSNTAAKEEHVLNKNKNNLLRLLPKVDDCIERLITHTGENIPLWVVKKSVQSVIGKMRHGVLEERITELPSSFDGWKDLFLKEISRRQKPRIRMVINGTGVVIHTNLGRSLLGSGTSLSLRECAANYSNLEFDLATGKRGSRYSLVEDLICEITGAESAIVVNNNAAAVLIALDTLAKNKEVIVSRGQLVEIGGSFRIPDVMAKSGATMIEVGATNRTHLYDYENNISEQTSLLLRVHSSNFRIIGFTSEVSPQDLVSLARKHNLITMEDLGSGCLIDLSRFGFPKEPTVQEVVSAGVDVVTFSGDKLLGGPQAGIIVGSRKIIDRIKKNPLNRALRIDKFTLAALESVLREYYDLEKAIVSIPTLRMITTPEESVKNRLEVMVEQLKGKISDEVNLQLLPVTSRVGGGSLPEFEIPSWALAIESQRIGPAQLEKMMRGLDIPVLGRIENDLFLLDGRTILDGQISTVVNSLIEVTATECR